MQALGNDYIVIDEFNEEKIEESKKKNFVKKICLRKFYVGADGVIFIQKSDKYDVKFRIFNADGSEAEMCGNGIRCFAKYVYERILKKNPLYVETKAGLRICEIFGDNKADKIKVYMGKPSFKPEDIPISYNMEFINKTLKLKNPYIKEIKATAISVGNPHLIVFLEDNNLDEEFIRKHLNIIGEEIEHHNLFPERINVHFVKTINNNEIKIITWERGVGYTMACGTGATASAVVANKLGKTGKKVVAHLDGGKLEIEIKDDGVYIIGDAEMIFDGKLLVDI